jgi:hypothetical protein
MEGKRRAVRQTCIFADGRRGIGNIARSRMAAKGEGVCVDMHAADALKLQTEFANSVKLSGRHGGYDSEHGRCSGGQRFAVRRDGCGERGVNRLPVFQLAGVDRFFESNVKGCMRRNPYSAGVRLRDWAGLRGIVDHRRFGRGANGTGLRGGIRRRRGGGLLRDRAGSREQCSQHSKHSNERTCRQRTGSAASATSPRTLRQCRTPSLLFNIAQCDSASRRYVTGS